MFWMKHLQLTIKILLYLTALTPLVVSQKTIFPFVFGKIVFFRGLVEVTLILFLIYLFFNLKNLQTRKLKDLIKNPLFIFILLFFVSFVLSAGFSDNSYRAFWGDIERGEGLFGLIHYLAFLLMALAIFEKKDWLNYFKISLVVGFILIFYALLQFLGIRNFPLALAPEPRPISYIGNPAFLATHMFFLMMFGAIVFLKTSKLWRYFSFLIIVLSVLTIFISGTRGAILGLGAGIFVLLLWFSISGRRYFFDLRKISVFLLILTVLLGAVFWFTRENLFWQKIPGLDRLAKTAALDVNDPSTQFRLITWKLSWKAFKEKPIFGWGPENYLMAYEKHYDPEYAVYGETWLDRAHNKIIDVAVMQGIFGLLAYLGIFAAVFYNLFKRLKTADSFYAPLIFSLLIGYFVQNLVLFDQIVSYAAFFAILGYILSGEQIESAAFESPLAGFKKLSLSVIAILIIIASGYSLYAYNYVPFVQARTFKASPGASQNVAVVEAEIRKAIYPYNFSQYNIRGSGVDTIYMNQYFYNLEYAKNPKFRPLGDILIEAIDEVARREPFDARIFIRQVEMINGLTRIMENEKETKPLFERAEKLMRKAIELAPHRQEVYYHLAFNLAGQGRFEESLETAKYAISLNPKVARAHFHLALMLAIANKNEEAAEILGTVENLDPTLGSLMDGDRSTTLLIYNLTSQPEKIAKLIIESLNRGEKYYFERRYYENILGYFAVKKDADNFIKVAAYLKEFNDLKEDMEVLIDLAEKGNWDIILRL